MRGTFQEAFAREIERVRALVPSYEALPNGIFASTPIKMSLAKAEMAARSGNLGDMLWHFQDLERFTMLERGSTG